MSLYRDELDAARHRIDALEADLRARDDALRAREVALEEHQAELSRLRRIASVGTTLPPTGRPPARGSVWAVAFAALVCSTAASTAFLVLPPPAPALLTPPPLPPPDPACGLVRATGDPYYAARAATAEGGSACPELPEDDLPQVVEPDRSRADHVRVERLQIER